MCLWTGANWRRRHERGTKYCAILLDKVKGGSLTDSLQHPAWSNWCRFGNHQEAISYTAQNGTIELGLDSSQTKLKSEKWDFDKQHCFSCPPIPFQMFSFGWLSRFLKLGKQKVIHFVRFKVSLHFSISWIHLWGKSQAKTNNPHNNVFLTVLVLTK